MQKRRDAGLPEQQSVSTAVAVGPPPGPLTYVRGSDWGRPGRSPVATLGTEPQRYISATPSGTETRRYGSAETLRRGSGQAWPGRYSAEGYS